MNCSHCGTPLPAGALFCGECGRRAAAPGAAPAAAPGNAPAAAAGTEVPAREDAPSPGGDRSVGDAQPSAAPELEGPPRRGAAGSFALADALADAVADTGPGGTLERIRQLRTADRRDAVPAPAADATKIPSPPQPREEPAARGSIVCAQCGAPMAIDDIFCEQCGFVSSAVTAAFTGVIPIGPPTPAAPSYIVAPPVAAAEPSGDEGEPAEAAVSEAEAAVPKAEPAVDDDESVPFMPAPPTDSRPIPLQPPAGIPVPLPTMPVEIVPSFGLVAPEPSAPAAFAPLAGRGVVGAAAPAFSSGTDKDDADKDDADDDDTEVTRIVARKPAAERFVLQFSTGESVSVSGTGLIGRNPKPEPGEFFDHVVRVLDSGRSVSKTHLEFGQERGTFWILDRFSGNGSVVRNPDAEPVRCDPGKRVMVSRGSRVEIGEQFFVVS